MFILLLYSIFRIFVVRYTPYSAVYVGCYMLAHTIYGGCPLLEFENVFARYLGLPEKVVGDVYVLFSDYSIAMRAVLFIAAIGLLSNAYRVWNKAETPFVIQNIWRKPIVKN